MGNHTAGRPARWYALDLLACESEEEAAGECRYYHHTEKDIDVNSLIPSCHKYLMHRPVRTAMNTALPNAQ